MNRVPPVDVRRRLRQEVNFGCPVPDCGVPYLEYNHFDPPWREREHHNPDGMIALCPTHHAQADADRWTQTQLRAMKSRPFVTPDRITSTFGYKRKDTAIMAGNLAFRVPNALEIDGERVIGTTRDSLGYSRLNLLLRDSAGSPILTMSDDDWTAAPRDLFDLDCGAQGRKLAVRAADGKTRFQLEFEDMRIDEFEALLSETGRDKEAVFQVVRMLGTPAYVPMWRLEGSLHYGTVEVELRRFAINASTRKMRGLHMEGSIVMGGSTALGLSNDGVFVGKA